MRPDADAQQALRRSSVAIVGCDGVGTWALGALASAGVGRFVLIDDDAVELGDLDRQILWGAADVGALKVDRAAAWLEAFDPMIAVRVCRRDVQRPLDLAEIGDCDALLLTAGGPPDDLARWANTAAVALGLPFITARRQPPLVTVGPTYEPGSGPCLACHEHGAWPGLALCDELADQRAAPPATVLGPASALAGSLLALEVVHLLLGVRPIATHGRAMVIDLRTLAVQWQPVERDPDCVVCAEAGAEHGG